ncbi:MAG: hypothetical protein IKW58_02155 [Alphaproteobacteria bacterium]|nr:hypothetical protein [Alphaproteobacteria bacterium]
MDEKNYVSYVVGTFLSFPIRVYHFFVPESDANEDEKKKSSQKQESPKHCDCSSSKSKSFDQKRNCGHSQKSTRVEHSKH